VICVSVVMLRCLAFLPSIEQNPPGGQTRTELALIHRRIPRHPNLVGIRVVCGDLLGRIIGAGMQMHSLTPPPRQFFAPARSDLSRQFQWVCDASNSTRVSCVRRAKSFRAASTGLAFPGDRFQIGCQFLFRQTIASSVFLRMKRCTRPGALSRCRGDGCAPSLSLISLLLQARIRP